MIFETKKHKISEVNRKRRIKNVRRKIKKSKQIAEKRVLLQKNAALVKALTFRKFASAKAGRLTSDWKVGSQSINSDILNQGDKIRDRSKDASLNNSHIKKYLKMFLKNVVGSQGFRLKPLIKDRKTGLPDKAANNIVRDAWADFSKPEHFTVTGRVSFYKFLTIFATQFPTDGEYIVHFAHSSDFKYGFSNQLIDPRLLDYRLNLSFNNGDYIRLGVKFNKWGRPLSYYFKKNNTRPHDEYILNSADYDVIKAEDIIHFFIEDDCVTVRGYPSTQIALLKLHNIESYTESELISARISSNKMGFLQTQEDAEKYVGQEEEADGSIITEVEAGVIEKLPYGYEFKAFDPGSPNSNMPDFNKDQLREAASGLDVSYNTLASDGENINFSTMRSFSLDEREGWMVIQRLLKEDLLDLIFNKFLDMAFLTNNLGNLPVQKLEEFQKHEFKARSFPWVDPLKDMQTNALAIKMGVKSRTMVCDEIGTDVKEVFDDLEEEKSQSKKKDINVDGATVSVTLTGEGDEDQDQK